MGRLRDIKTNRPIRSIASPPNKPPTITPVLNSLLVAEVIKVPAPVSVPTKEELTLVSDVGAVIGELENFWLIIINFQSKSTYISVLVFVLVPVAAVAADPELGTVAPMENTGD